MRSVMDDLVSFIYSADKPTADLVAGSHFYRRRREFYVYWRRRGIRLRAMLFAPDPDGDEGVG